LKKAILKELLRYVAEVADLCVKPSIDLLTLINVLFCKLLPFLARTFPSGGILFFAMLGLIRFLSSFLKLAKFQLIKVIKDPQLDLVNSQHISRRY
jgi:hypothetical protein